jgi:hypothetical protein
METLALVIGHTLGKQVKNSGHIFGKEYCCTSSQAHAQGDQINIKHIVKL